MLYQDTLTGTLHEVPDGQVYGWGLAEDPYGEAQMVYDGLGNPLGWGFLKKIRGLVKKAMPLATSFLGPYGQIINKAIPIVTRALGPTGEALRRQAMAQLSTGQPAPMQVGAMPFEGVPIGVPQPAALPMAVPPTTAMAARPQFPGGWIRPPQANAGPRPGRLYLRCSTWRGPRGLVPKPGLVSATGAPTTVVPGVVAPVPVPRAIPRRRRRR